MRLMSSMKPGNLVKVKLPDYVVSPVYDECNGKWGTLIKVVSSDVNGWDVWQVLLSSGKMRNFYQHTLEVINEVREG